MRLIHFAAEPMVGVWPVPQISYRLGEFSPKPKGLWVSDEDDYGWREWCTNENYGEDRLEVAHEVALTGPGFVHMRCRDARRDGGTVCPDCVRVMERAGT